MTGLLRRRRHDARDRLRHPDQRDGKRSILPFFFIGFFIVKIFGCSALQLACLGIPMAIAIVLMTKDSEDATVKRALAATASDDDDDE